jgi:hypothetical protein
MSKPPKSLKKGLREAIDYSKGKDKTAEEFTLKQRAKRGSKQKFRKALSKVPNVEPEESDR